METKPNRRRCRVLPALLAAAAGVALTPAAPAAAQCYQRSPYLSGSDVCGTATAGLTYDTHPAFDSYFASAGNTSYVIATQSNDWAVYDVSIDPVNPAFLTSGHIPWDWSQVAGEGTHGQYNNHLRFIATTPGFQYGFAMLGGYGWDVFKLNGRSSGFLGHGYKPTNLLASPYQSAVLFQVGTQVWAAAQALDQASINGNDFSIRLYLVGNGSPAFTEGLSPANIGNTSYVVPIGHAGDALPNTQFSLGTAGMRLFVLYGNSKTFLIARSLGSQTSTVAVVDVSTPSSPRLVTSTSDPQLATNSVAAHQDHMMLWAGDSAIARAYGYPVDPDSGLIGTPIAVDWLPGAPNIGGASVPSASGDLLAIVGVGHVAYVSLAGHGTPTVLPNYGDWSSYPTRTCLNSAYSDGATRATVFQAGNPTKYAVCRTIGWNHDIVTVGDSCISTVPSPNFSVMGGNSAAVCSGDGQFTQADAGFPGDTFTIKDTSGGVWVNATLDVQSPLGTSVGTMGGQSFPMTITPGQAVSWNPPATTAPGNFYVVLSISGGTPPSKTQEITLCANPKAALTVQVATVNCVNPANGCTALVNDTVALGDTGTQGTPAGNPTYFYSLGGAPASQGSSFTAAYGNYTVGVVVPYGFSATLDPTCNNVLFNGYSFAGTYYSCALGTVTAGYGTASFQVEQPAGTVVATATTPGSINIASAVTLKFLGRIATGYTPSFQWNVPGLSNSQLTCSYTAAPYANSTCTIPANTLSAGAAAPWNLTVNVCSAGGLGSPPAACTGTGDPVSQPPAPPVTVTPTANSFSFSASPTSVNVGTPITITLQNVVGTYQNLTFNLGGTACDTSTQLVYNCVTPFGNQCVNGTNLPTFSYGPSEKGNTDTITASGNLINNGGSVVSPTQVPVLVSSTGTCPCPTVSVNVNGPTSALVGATVQFSATASSPGYSITGYSWNYGDGSTDNGTSVSHSYANAGTYTVRVTATSSCGNTGSDTMAIVVGGGPGGGSLTITPSPRSANTGQNVTFTFSPKVTVQGDSVTFNFGDGTSQTVSYSAICQIAGGCNIVTHAYSAAGTFTVTGSGTASSSSVSGSTTITVINNCTATSAPTAAFSWTPTQPQVNQAIQFTDLSTGSPTSWSWSFGTSVAGSGVNGVVALAAGTLTIAATPANPAVGASVKFTFSPGVSVSGDGISFNFGDGSTASVPYSSMLCSTVSPCSSILHTFKSGGVFTVSASGTAGGQSVSGSTSITVTGSSNGTLVITPTPQAPSVNQNVTFTFSPALAQNGDAVTFTFGDTTQQTISYPSCGIACNAVTHAYSTAGTYSIAASGTAGGVAVAGSASVTVTGGGGGGGGTSTVQSPVFTYTTPGTYTVTFTASNCKGASTLQQQITVLPLCSQTAVPTANFTWGPTGPLTGFPEQQQPYVGQQVTLTDASTNSPTSWTWYDFQELFLQPTTVTVPTFTATWTAAGDKNVRMKATNCLGTSAEVLKPVHVYPDVRHVSADFSWSPDPINTGAAIVFSAVTGAAYGDPDTFVWTFDDTQGTVTGASVSHTFSCAGTHRVTLVTSRSNYPAASATVKKQLTVNGTLCGPQSVVAVDNANLPGKNGTYWRTDVRIFNPSADASGITLWFLPVNQDNTTPFSAGPYTIPPKGTLAQDDVLGWVAGTLGKSFSKTALRVTYQNILNEAPMVIGRTYTQSPGGGTYGQFTPGIGVYPGTTVSPVWLTGLRNNGSQTGFRTNYSLVNLLPDIYAGNINITLYDSAGAPQKTVSLGLGPSGYLQDSIANLFGTTFSTVGTFSLRVDVPPGADIQAYGSVVDNQTGAPVLVPAGPPAVSPIYLPAVAHTSGKNGTVWRSDMQLTNADTVAHTWKVTYRAKATDPVPPEVSNMISLSPQQSYLMADALGWVFNGSLADSTNTSGVIKITPADGGAVYPVVQARSFNQTAAGTFGQNITPFTADSGVAADSPETRLLLTGMSTTDTGFRTNVGFVNLSETDSVNFAVIFYDESGNVLNPKGNDGNTIPYTFALGVGGWDQDQLENRFRNAFGTALPANLRAISAEIFVTGGGPGSVYATVIDNVTGDPVFIPAQPAP